MVAFLRFRLFLLSLAGVAVASPLAGQTEISFLSVSLGDAETRQADRELSDYLEVGMGDRGLNVQVESLQLEYRAMIDRLAEWDDGAYLARATPYVAVVARMLGAQFDVLATYVSATTNQRTYNSYFVVNRANFTGTPDLDQLTSYLRNSDEPATFVYHDKFSTSSYFLPSLYFKNNGIYDTDLESLTAIHGEHIEQNSSTAAARRVATDPQAFAAVWDGTKAKFEPGGSEYAQHGRSVRFIRLPTPLPNDLLIAHGLGAAHIAAIDSAISQMRSEPEKQINIGDFARWEPIRVARDAREAFASLGQLAATTPPFVTVRVKNDTVDPVSPEYLMAAQQAIRFSGSEFVVYDADFHERADYEWTLSLIHDGAVMLRSNIQDYGRLEPQVYRFSFQDESDLTNRITTTIHSRLHRVRYIWPYLPDKPTVVRDVDFALSPGTQVSGQRIAWYDPPKNQFELIGLPLNFEVVEADYHRFEFTTAGLADMSLDPLSNLAYRVVLERPRQESALMRFLTYFFVLLLLCAGAGAAWDLLHGSRATGAQRHQAR